MKIEGESQTKSRVGIGIWDKTGKKNAKGKKSVSFTVSDTTMDELEQFIKEKIRTES